MTEYLLDTNIWIGLARGEVGLQERLRGLRVSQVHCCSVVRAELEFGARKSERVEANLSGFARLLAPFDSAPFDDEAAARYGVIRAVLEASGMPIGGNDCMIAAVALARDWVVVSRNAREFVRVPGLRVEVW